MTIICVMLSHYTKAQINIQQVDSVPYHIYPKLNDKKPELPSPFIFEGKEYVIAVTKEGKYTITEVSLNNNSIGQQQIEDNRDFPELISTGLHSESKLDNLETITGRTLDHISHLALPGELSQAGFMAEDEDILSVLKGDNQLVKKLGLTHPDLAKPLFHVLNMMDADLKLNRWNMAKHKWENIVYFFYNGGLVYVEAEDTKGGQISIFDDGIEGAFYIKLWRDIKRDELNYLKENYAHLSNEQFDDMLLKLSSLNTGEMEPQYILKYGFYEGHTFWRTDPVTVSFIFGFKNIEELDKELNKSLYKTLTSHYTDIKN